jgi:hypothetical protein
MAIKVEDLVGPMIGAARNSLAQDWPKAEAYSEMEFRKLAQSLADIAALIAAGKVNEQQAVALLNVHKNTTLMVLLTIEGLGVIAVENAINAALNAVAGVVNTAAGVALI